MYGGEFLLLCFWIFGAAMIGAFLLDEIFKLLRSLGSRPARSPRRNAEDIDLSDGSVHIHTKRVNIYETHQHLQLPEPRQNNQQQLNLTANDLQYNPYQQNLLDSMNTNRGIHPPGLGLAINRHSICRDR